MKRKIIGKKAKKEIEYMKDFFYGKKKKNPGNKFGVGTYGK